MTLSKQRQCRQEGFIALMSAVVISVLLLAITVSLGFSGFFTIFNVLDSESKERSRALAEACADVAMLNLAQSQPQPTIPVPVGPDHCNIISVQGNVPKPSQTTIQTQACVNKSVTNLRIIIGGDFKVISLEELPNFSPGNPCI